MFYIKIYLKKKVKIRRKINIAKGTEFNIDGTLIFSGIAQTSFGDYIRVSKSASLSIGDNVYLGRNVIISAKESIVIGDNCTFGPGVTIYDHDHKLENGKVCSTKFVCEPIIIGSGCWLGTGVILLKGCHIGDNCVIGAGSVIKRSIPANTIVYNKRNIHISNMPD